MFEDENKTAEMLNNATPEWATVEYDWEGYQYVISDGITSLTLGTPDEDMAEIIGRINRILSELDRLR